MKDADATFLVLVCFNLIVSAIHLLFYHDLIGACALFSGLNTLNLVGYFLTNIGVLPLTKQRRQAIKMWIRRTLRR